MTSISSATGIPINCFKHALTAGQVQIGLWNSLVRAVAQAFALAALVGMNR